MSKSLGEKRVRTTFNPSSDDIVQKIKDKSADLINIVAMIEYSGENEETTRERARLVALALTDYEQAAMWAVKAATI